MKLLIPNLYMKIKIIKINLERKQDLQLAQDYEWDGETSPLGLKKTKKTCI